MSTDADTVREALKRLARVMQHGDGGSAEALAALDRLAAAEARADELAEKALHLAEQVIAFENASAESDDAEIWLAGIAREAAHLAALAAVTPTEATG